MNELNDTVENLKDEINFMTTEIQRFQDDDVKHEEQRISIMKEMEVIHLSCPSGKYFRVIYTPLNPTFI